MNYYKIIPRNIKVIKSFCYKNFKKRKINTSINENNNIDNRKGKLEDVNQNNETGSDDKYYEIPKSIFKNNKELLILEVDNQQRILIFGFLSFVFVGALYCLYYTFKKNEKRIIYKVFMFIIGLFLLKIIFEVPKSIKKFITKIYLLDCGEKIRICYYFNKSEIVKCTDFKRLSPINNYVSIEEYKKLLIEGYPILINENLKVVSRNSKFYYKDIYKELEKSIKFKLV